MKAFLIWQLNVACLTAAGFATSAFAQVTTPTPCAVEAEKSRLVNGAKLGLNPMPADPSYDRSVNDFTAADRSLVKFRIWIAANPKHLCAPDARSEIAPREARIAEFSRVPAQGVQLAKRIGPSPISPDDFPYDQGQSGQVAIKLFVEADGRPEICIVTSSSGVSRFDDLSCRQFMRKGRFDPARDARGLPISSWVEQNIKWAAP